MNNKYNHKDVEANKYQKWIDLGLFKADMDKSKEPFSLIMPPPNVTGKLHLGHSLDNSIQDLLIRFKKLNGFATVWVPGMDHAGIATQVVVDKHLKEQGIDKNKLSKEEFLDHIWEWKKVYEKNIRNQWSKFGLALDYNLEQFTFSEHLQDYMKDVFVKMYNSGLIYEDETLVNWDPILGTAISNIEVIHSDVKGKMYYFKYFFEDSKEFLEVATTRPETMFGDICLVVNPKDKRYSKFIGKNVINPANNQIIPIIADKYVDIEFGTGVMKCTPAHDRNDFDLGKKHNLPIINVMNYDATMNDKCGQWNGFDRFDARKGLVESLKANDTLIRIEEIEHQVGLSERSKTIVEPMLSKQWFVKMESLANNVIKMQESQDPIRFYPNRFDATLKGWMENIHDWTISRQLVWGHQLPVWYNKKNKDQVHVSVDGPTDPENWKRSDDVLDTWASSSLWPMVCLGYDPNKSEEDQSDLYKQFWPVSTMITGYDILFFWVARMMFTTQYINNDKKAFNDVLMHGLVRDEQGRKMSKSLGNGIDPLIVIEEYGADTLRHSLVVNSSPGMDIKFSVEKIRSSWNLANKIWNASRYVVMKTENMNASIEESNLIKNINKINEQWNVANKWILYRTNATLIELKKQIDKYEFAIAGKVLDNFIWNEYCSWYIELSKANIESDNLLVRTITQQTLLLVLKKLLIMIHPFMPFISEEIYKVIGDKESILREEWMFKFEVKISDDEIEDIENVFELIEKIRSFRLNNEIKNVIQLKFTTDIKNNYDSINSYLLKMVNSSITYAKDASAMKNISTIALTNLFIYIKNSDFINTEEVMKKLNEDIIKVESELVRLEKMLSNESFILKASKDKIDAEKLKQIKYKEQYDNLLLKLNQIKK
ncbi:valyl-tRNA synthetase [Spiroplasma sp. TIUS-1]|uniref:valine--tRNA ligase n=1 Tax=Spiroplasma sp. TIUS-1 TaxID=216963 RepID=UPI0013975F85|nr:valine--tRNA ligase [Spiroplasma sp. TIUS-1]QHX35933.1 valyl-tRNA synthetase [Spiroplasma sp. TIUS-1]